MAAEIGSTAPAFSLLDQSKNFVSSESLKGHKGLVVFIPFPFTGNCEAELCMIRDRLADLNNLDANVVAITCDTVPVNKRWSDENGFQFPVLSDFWPHGVTTQSYGAFNDKTGSANRYTFVLDADGVVRDVINTESLGITREFELYVEALQALG